MAKNLFVPLSLAVAFAMVASFLLSSSFLPVLFLWLHRKINLRPAKRSLPDDWDFDKVRDRWGTFLERLGAVRGWSLEHMPSPRLELCCCSAPQVGKELFPAVGATQFRLRFDAPTGTRAEETERLTTGVLERDQGGGRARATSRSLSGMSARKAASYPINTVFLWTSGPHEAVMNVALRPGARIDVAPWKRSCGKFCLPSFPGATFSFEPGDLVSQIMNFGAPTPVEVAVTGPDLAAVALTRKRLRGEMAKVADPARSEIRAAARLSQRRREHGPGTGRPTGRNRRAGRRDRFRKHRFQPLHDPQLLGRPEDR